MLVLAGPFLAGAALLVVAGGSKVRDPLPLVRALRSAGVPASGPLVRAIAGAELSVGAAAVLTGSRPAAVLLAASYAAFTGFVLLALARGGVLASCGCFGRADTPPTRTHAVLTGVVALVGAAVAVRPQGALTGVLAEAGPALLPATAALAVTLYLALAVLPLLRARPVAAS